MSYYEWYTGRRRIMEAAQTAAGIMSMLLMFFGMLALCVIC